MMGTPVLIQLLTGYATHPSWLHSALLMRRVKICGRAAVSMVDSIAIGMSSTGGRVCRDPNFDVP